ncbi:Aste57867_8856 [Aphanomyces stellatus]|uniref:Aste57867_8856 protein n=1 Tax=Aphanomyces stellatus TaxID=120398 RepID=A0A485KLE0_9STRA|nr:hypothetical protein As57867_008821 [Aphanomyces stellatus]VFT85742.1 Aste57867_8856 [Aphanomyces stellatus]
MEMNDPAAFRLPPSVDWDALTSLSTAMDALHALLHSDIVLDVPVLVMGQPALLFAASMYDEDLARLILSMRHRLPLDVNTMDSHGFTALHYAADSDMSDLVGALLQCSDIDARATTEDLSVLGHVESGGRTALHLAALRGNLEIIQALLAFDVTLATCVDWDGNTPARLAQLYDRAAIAKYFTDHVTPNNGLEIGSHSSIAEIKRRQQQAASNRYHKSLQVPDALQTAHVLPRMWSAEQCDRVLQLLVAATDKIGWQTKRHTAYPTTDLPSYCLPHLDRWVQTTLKTSLFPAILNAYEMDATTTELSFRDLFYVKYEAAGPSVQNDLGLHCDGSTFSFNILLNPASDFEGGGTYFSATDTTIHIEQGHAVVHSGRVVHGAAPVRSGKRLILVGFLNVRERRRPTTTAKGQVA